MLLNPSLQWEGVKSMSILILIWERVVFSLRLPLVPTNVTLSVLGDPGIMLYHCQTHKNIKKMSVVCAKILERFVIP